MKVFRDLFSEDEELQRIVNTSIQFPRSIQGVVVELHPFWILYLNILNNRQDLNEDDLNDLLYLIERHLYSGHPLGSIFNNVPYVDPFIPAAMVNIEDIKHNKWWKRLYDNFAGRNLFQIKELPIVVKICLYSSREGNIELPRFESNRFSIIYETRDSAYLLSNPKKKYRPIVGGVSIGATKGNFGTLGGILKDKNSDKIYGLTCSHVTDIMPEIYQPSLPDSNKSETIGDMIYKSTLNPCPPNDPCNKFTSITNEYDFALIEINDKFSYLSEILDIGKIADIAPESSIMQGNQVEFEGRTSKHKNVEIGGFGIYYRFVDSNGDILCYKFLYELKKRGFWRNLLSKSVVKKGDSGAWVIKSSNSGNLFCGIICGGDGDRGYVITTDAAKHWWTSLGLDLYV